MTTRWTTIRSAACDGRWLRAHGTEPHLIAVGLTEGRTGLRPHAYRITAKQLAQRVGE
jgi:hypothetical protein